MANSQTPTWFSDADLVARLTITEDQFTERKSRGDRGGWLKTAVAFANSAPIGYPAVLFIGVDDAGSIAEGTNTEDVIKSFSDFLSAHAYPPIYTAPRILTHLGRSCIAVIIPGSENRPHFAGRAFVRDGTQTRDASPEQFATLIAQRNSKVYEILKRRGNLITFQTNYRDGLPGGETAESVVDCNPFFVTLNGAYGIQSFPLSDVEISLDSKNNRLRVERRAFFSRPL